MDDSERVRRWLDTWASSPGLVRSFGMTFSRGEEGFETHMTVTEAMMGGPGVAHGGVALALLDTGLGVAVLSQSLPKGQAASTIEILSLIHI